MPFVSPIRHQRTTQEKYHAALEIRNKMTTQETKVWSRLRGNRLGGFHFRRQQIIEPFIVDFYCHSCSLVVEIDGGIHTGQEEYDYQREEFLIERGYQVLRFTNNEVDKDLDHVLAIILNSCTSSQASG